MIEYDQPLGGICALYYVDMPKGYCREHRTQGHRMSILFVTELLNPVFNTTLSIDGFIMHRFCFLTMLIFVGSAPNIFKLI